MRIYYLDEPLNADDLSFFRESMVLKEGLMAIQNIVQIRLPMVLPTVDADENPNQSVRKQIELLKGNLLNAGIEKDLNTQIAFIMPKETYWGAVIQLSILELTGFAPYVIQRWSVDDEGNIVKRNTRIIDGHGMIGGKD